MLTRIEYLANVYKSPDTIVQIPIKMSGLNWYSLLLTHSDIIVIEYLYVPMFGLLFDYSPHLGVMAFCAWLYDLNYEASIENISHCMSFNNVWICTSIYNYGKYSGHKTDGHFPSPFRIDLWATRWYVMYVCGLWIQSSLIFWNELVSCIGFDRNIFWKLKCLAPLN